VLFGVGLEMKVSFGWFVSLVAAVAMVGGGLLTYLGGPQLEFEGGEASAPQEQSTDGPGPTILSRRDG
jgi:hypothetical protein